MNTDKLNRWLSLLANFGVVVGLILLIVEIRQNTDFIRQEAIVARADFGQGAFADSADLHEAMMDPAIAEIFGKVINNPGELTQTEAIQFSNFLHQTMVMLNRDYYGARVGVYELGNNLSTRILPQFFGNNFARMWWKATMELYNPGFVLHINEEIAKLPEHSNQHFFEELRVGQ